MTLTLAMRNRIGFILLGLTNNFAYVIMLSAAYDLLKQSETNAATSLVAASNSSQSQAADQKYCNEHSTSTILLADTIPALTTKLMYPLLLVGLPVAHKATATAFLSAASFLMTGLTSDRILIFAGVACASFSSGLGESTYLSNTLLYGDVALSGWSIGTGGAGLLGAAAYAILRTILTIKVIMIVMLIVPISMIMAYFLVLEKVDSGSVVGASGLVVEGDETLTGLSIISRLSEDEQQIPVEDDLIKKRNYGASESTQTPAANSLNLNRVQIINDEEFGLRQKINHLPNLARYFMPLLLVYFAEYFINQGLFELIYYPSINFLDHAAQYRWFQVTYQLGVFISRSSLDIFQIRQLWTMSILQAVNAIIFLAHTSKLIHIPSFYIVIALIVYEGLLGGFTYANTFYRMKRELTPRKHEFSVSTVTIADTLGIVMAGIVALPIHNALCKLYKQ